MKTNLRLSILKVLAVTPNGYSQTYAAMCSSLRLAHYPEPSDGDITAALTRLEQEHYILAIADEFDGMRYTITPLGREVANTH